jgi:hypothetical protein
MHDEAYDELLAATPPGWWVGRPMRHDERNEWQMYAFDPSERPVVGQQARVDRRSTDRGRRRQGDGALPARDRLRGS